MNARTTKLLTTLLLLTVSHTMLYTAQENSITATTEPLVEPAENEQGLPVINDIIVKGNKNVTTEAILYRLPYKKENLFVEEESDQAIHLIYGLGYFKQVQLEAEDLPDNKVNLYVFLEEMKLLDKIEINGTKHLKKKKIREKINAEKIKTVDGEVARRIVNVIDKFYKENNYHNVEITHQLLIKKSDPGKLTLRIDIKEGPISKVTRVFFKGNKRIPDRTLSNFIFTRESWLFGILSDAGKLDKDELDKDKHRLEYFYRDHGYLTARVVDTKVEFIDKNKEVHITFEVREGEQFTINSVAVLGDDIFTDEELKQFVFLHEGEIYSQKKMLDTITRLKNAWGAKGYIYADVFPDVRPDEDAKTVDVIFRAERGTKMYTNRIDITGNKLTRDKVIRRELSFEEGDLITSDDLSASKNNVEFLSYFERGGVNWKIHRLTEELADLELNVQEAKTGSFNFNMSYGSNEHSSKRALKGQLQVSKRNLFGRGWDTQLMLQGRSDFTFQKFIFSFFDPYMFDTNISGGIDAYIKHEEYDQWRNVTPSPKEEILGGTARIGLAIPALDKRLLLYLTAGIEDVDNNNPTAFGPNMDLLQPIVDRHFQSGTLFWLQSDLVIDARNHKVYPTNGYRYYWQTKFAPGVSSTQPFNNNTGFGFIKSEMEASWFTALIGEDDLVLGLRAKGGIVRGLTDCKIIPYKELYHMGGQSTVRGFAWGSIGPAYLGDPVGARNMVLFNAELTFPLLNDYSMKAHFFYDAGAGWDTPKQALSDRSFLRRDKFNLRHSIGFGLNLMYPQAVKIDWGYKLDRDAAAGESPHEWHISMNTAW